MSKSNHSVGQSVTWLVVCQSIIKAVHLLISLDNPAVSQFVSQSISQSVGWLVSPSFHSLIHLSVCPSVPLSISLTISQSINQVWQMINHLTSLLAE